MSDQPQKNTDRELYREPKGDLPSDYYAPSVHVTADGRIGINVGGHVIVQTIREWHHAGRFAGIPDVPPETCSTCGWGGPHPAHCPESEGRPTLLTRMAAGGPYLTGLNISQAMPEAPDGRQAETWDDSLTFAGELRVAARRMREQHRSDHKRHEMWAAMADLLEAESHEPYTEHEDGAYTTGGPSLMAVRVARAYLDATPDVEKDS